MRRAIVTLAITSLSGTLGAAGVIAGCGSGEQAPAAENQRASAPLAEPLAKKSCSVVVGKMLSADITPPNLFVGQNLAGPGGADGGLGGGGLTIEQSGLERCVQYQDPQKESDPGYPGFRTAGFTNAADAGDASFDLNDPISISYNEESHVISQVVLSGASVSGTLQFDSRAGGAYGSGHHYVVSLGATDDAAVGSITKDGADFPADWSYHVTKKGVYEASAWANEIYDGILSTYLPAFPAASTGDCLTSTFTGDGLGIPVPGTAECLFFGEATGGSYLGVRPLHFYLIFSGETNHVQAVYEDWGGGTPTCSTPKAAIERMQFGAISWGGSYNATSGYGPFIGNLPVNQAISQPGGLTSTEAQDLNGCGGVSVTAPDPGYDAIQWGKKGEIEMEYDAKTGVAYKVFGKAGYEGSLFLQSAPESDGGVDTYVLAVGSLTLNGAAYTIDWSTADKAAASVTPISNALLAYYLGVPADKNCVKSGDCTVTIDDGMGHSTFSFTPTAAGPALPLTWVFDKGSSVPTEVYTVNPGGM